MSELRLTATVEPSGRLRFDRPDLVLAELSQLSGQRVRVAVTRERLTRSIDQNRYLWGHIYGEAVANGVELVEIETGQPVFKTRDDVHGFAKLLLLRRPVLTNMGELNLLGTTTTLSVAEFSEYCERLCAKLAQLGVYIPPAGGGR